jgi:hypothetical protein
VAGGRSRGEVEVGRKKMPVRKRKWKKKRKKMRIFWNILF